ncbi:MAG TPA: cytochrome c biogenesis protein CcsA [Gaiellaceae bacterium]|nr:cytochrome c biogenesis protein CcsA [Gaiellaceae bacterium]
MIELLFLPALLGYGEAALAYAGDAWHPGWAGRLATWGVRLGWLAQTALIAVLFAGSGGFPWDTWAGTLNLFVWLVVGIYLVWGCRARYRLLGLAIMPLAAGLLLASWLAGGDSEGAAAYSTPFLVFHVGLVLAAFAGLTVAAAMSALYLFEERRLKLRRTASLLGRMPSLVTLDALAARTVLVSLPALAAGIGLGLVQLRDAGGGFDPLMGVSLATIAVYAAYVLLRVEAGWSGRRAAYLALAGFALVIVVRLALPLAHFA